MTVGASQSAGDGVRSSDWQTPPASPSVASKSPDRSSKRLRVARRIAWNLLPPLTFIAMVGLWWAAVEAFKIPAYLLPGPRGVFTRLVTDAPLLWTHSKVTLAEILLGFGLTVVTA